MSEYLMSLIINSGNPELFGFSFAMAMFVIAFAFWFGVAVLGLSVADNLKS